MDVLGGLFDGIKEVFEEFRVNGFCGVLVWDKFKVMF